MPVSRADSTPARTPIPQMLGSGLAANAGAALANGGRRVDDAVDRAVGGYANGGMVTDDEIGRALNPYGYAPGGKTASPDQVAQAMYGYQPAPGGSFNTSAPGQGFMDKLRSVYGALGVSTAPIENNTASGADKLRYLIGAAPIASPATGAKPDAMTEASPTWAPASGAVAPATASPPAPVTADEIVTGQRNLQAVNAPQANGAPLTATDIRGTMVPKPGTGAFVNNTTGKVTNLTAQPTGYGAAPVAYQSARGGMGAFVGAMLNMKRSAAQDKQAQESALKLPDMTKNAYEAEALRQRIALANQQTDPLMRAAILAGHNPPENRLQAPPNLQPLPGDKDQSGVVFDANTGTFRKVPIQPAAKNITMAEATASAEKNGLNLTPAQIRAELAQRGYTVTD